MQWPSGFELLLTNLLAGDHPSITASYHATSRISQISTQLKSTDGICPSPSPPILAHGVSMLPDDPFVGIARSQDYLN